MKFAMIAPASPNTKNIVRELGLSYHMVLGQYLKNEAYYNMYSNWRRSGHFIMVDNGAAEGANVPFATIATYATGLGADEIVMPDVYRNAEATLKGWYSRDMALVPPIRRIMIPQGETVQEWCDCFDALMKSDISFATLGIPKHLDRFPHGRVQALGHVVKRHYARIMNIHLFGVYANAEKEICDALYVCPSVRGIDSGCAVAYAQNDADLSCGTHYGIEMDGPVPYSSTFFNARKVLGWCNGEN